jgi:hypothetical protein
MPPKPKALTAARRGRFSFLRCQGSGRVCTRKGLLNKGLCRGALLKFNEGGKILWCNASSVLIIPAAAAAVNKWPIMDFTEPMAH